MSGSFRGPPGWEPKGNETQFRPVRTTAFSSTSGKLSDRAPHEESSRRAEAKVREDWTGLLTDAEIDDIAMAETGAPADFDTAWAAPRLATEAGYGRSDPRGSQRLRAYIEASRRAASAVPDANVELQAQERAEAVENRKLDLEMERAIARGEVVDHGDPVPDTTVDEYETFDEAVPEADPELPEAEFVFPEDEAEDEDEGDGMNDEEYGQWLNGNYVGR
jgi:hypothetical protein